MRILAIDPGTTQSAYVVYNTGVKKVLEYGKIGNEELLGKIEECQVDKIVIETIKSYGNVIGDSVLETCIWIGRFLQMAQPILVDLIPRKTVVTIVCNNPRAKDKNVRQALIDRFGGKEVGIGTKKTPGPLYGIAKDVWSALAVAIAWQETYDNLMR